MAIFAASRATAAAPRTPGYLGTETSCATSHRERRSESVATPWAATPKATSATTRTTHAASPPRATIAARLPATRACASSIHSACRDAMASVPDAARRATPALPLPTVATTCPACPIRRACSDAPRCPTPALRCAGRPANPAPSTATAAAGTCASPRPARPWARVGRRLRRLRHTTPDPRPPTMVDSDALSTVKLARPARPVAMG